MTRKTATAALAVVMLGATALTTTDAFAFRPTQRVAAFKVAPRATAAPRHAVVKATPRYASFKATHKYAAPRSFPTPSIDPGSLSNIPNPGKTDPGSSSFLPKIDPSSLSKTVTNKPPGWQVPAGAGGKLSDAIPKASPLKTPVIPGDKVGQQRADASPLHQPAPARPKDKVESRIPRKPTPCPPGGKKPGQFCYGVEHHPQLWWRRPGTANKPGMPSMPGSGHWPSDPSNPGGPVETLPSPDAAEQPASVSAPERVVTERAVLERPAAAIRRTADASAPACGIPALAAGIDALMPTARLTAAEFATVKALRAAIAELAAAGNEASARELEAQAMRIVGYTKVWLRCGPGTFTWEKLPAAG
jgi:hypothetical protein